MENKELKKARNRRAYLKNQRERQAYARQYYTETKETRKRQRRMRSKRYYESHKSEAQEYSLHYRMRRPEQNMFFSARQRAQKMSMPFRLTREWIRKQLEPGRCQVTGLPFRFDKSAHRKNTPFAPRLDRKNPELGYTKENVQVVVWIYNRAKADSSHDDVLRLAARLVAS